MTCGAKSHIGTHEDNWHKMQPSVQEIIYALNVYTPKVQTFHCRTRQFLVPLALRGGIGVSGSQLRVVKLAGSEGFPCKQLYMAWTLEVQNVHNIISSQF